MVKSRYLEEQTSDPLSGVLVAGADPDDAGETDNVLKLKSNVACLKLAKLFTELLQYRRVG